MEEDIGVDFFTNILNRFQHDSVVKKHHKIIVKSIYILANRLKELQTQHSKELLDLFDVAKDFTFANETDEEAQIGSVEYPRLEEEFGNH